LKRKIPSLIPVQFDAQFQVLPLTQNSGFRLSLSFSWFEIMGKRKESSSHSEKLSSKLFERNLKQMEISTKKVDKKFFNLP